MHRRSRQTKSGGPSFEKRLKALRLFFLIFACIIGFRLFMLQIVNAGFYDSLASGQHDFYQELIAQRGEIVVRDWKDGTEYTAATNEARAFVYAEPRKVEDPIATAQGLAKVLGYEITVINSEDEIQETPGGILDGVFEEEGIEGGEDVEGIDDSEDQIEEIEEPEEEGPSDYEILVARLSKEDDPYEPVARNVSESQLNKILDQDLAGIHYVLEDARSYPEKNLGGHVFGFVAQNDEGMHGQYGLEGRFDEYLSGANGFLDIVTDIGGQWIGVGKREFSAAQDGGDLLLTIDRTIQYIACKALAEGVERYEADGGSVVIIEPATGKVMAMCNAPDFDPNTYNEVESISVYNNAAIFDSYEPGSVFKPLIMAAALDVDAVSPTETYTDTGEEKIDEYTIRNSDLKAHGIQTMTQVLEESLNTGMIYVMRQMGGELMTQYIEDFGFGVLTGIELDTEAAGTIDSLYNDHEIYYATASYGQGITSTVLQITMAYAALANDGWLMEPFIVEEKQYNDGTIEDTQSHAIRQVIDGSTATTIGAMLVSVIENGHAGAAGVDGYYIAGKTGTAQVASSEGGYLEDATIATFSGFGPVEDPQFAMVVRIDHPRTTPWAADTAAPVFGEIADFILDYLEVPPTR